MQTKDCPKVSIITCVYNGEKYISKLLDSVLNMGYPNIEHIIVNDGSTDSTEDIVMKYVELYENKENSNLYIKYVKQENIGLGGATNTGLKQITGEYWTWINCDDWYESHAFFEPIEMMISKPRIDYVQMNGYYYYKNGTKKLIVKNNCKMHFNNRYHLFVDYCERKHLKYLLYICRTSSFKNINKQMRIYPSKYTQDEQLMIQLFALLNGSIVLKPKWYFTQRVDSYTYTAFRDRSEEYNILCEKTFKLMEKDGNNIDPLIQVRDYYQKVFYLKKLCKLGKNTEAKELYQQLKIAKKSIDKRYKLYLHNKYAAYYIFYIIFGI